MSPLFQFYYERCMMPRTYWDMSSLAILLLNCRRHNYCHCAAECTAALKCYAAAAGATISEEYVTEYSTDKIEMHTGHITEGQRVLLVR